MVAQIPRLARIPFALSWWALSFPLAALSIEESFLSDAVGPKAFPLIIAAVLGLASIVIALRPDPDPTWPALGRLAEIGAAMARQAGQLAYASSTQATTIPAIQLATRLSEITPGDLTTCGDKRVQQFVRGEAGERLMEMRQAENDYLETAG